MLGCEIPRLKVLYSSDRPLPTLVQACDSSLLPISNVQRLDITTRHPQSRFELRVDAGDTQRIDILHPFSAAKSLSLGSMYTVPPVAFALKQVGHCGGMADVLPTIHTKRVRIRGFASGTRP